MIKAPFSITVDTQGNRWVWPAYKDLKLPQGHEMESVMPMVMCAVRDVQEAITLYREGNQARVNEILKQYY